MKKAIIILLGILGFLAIVNLGFLNLIIYKNFDKLGVLGDLRDVRDAGENIVEDKVASPSCELSCQGIIEEKIKEELEKLPNLAGQSSVSPPVIARTKTPTPVNGKPKIAYIPLVASGSIASVDWTDIIPSEFYFNLTDYPNAKEVRFEAYLSSSNGDQVYARIYDATNKRGVDFSDLLTSSNAYTRIESSPIKIWAGSNKYTVQLRSVNGTTVNLKDGKLKIIY